MTRFVFQADSYKYTHAAGQRARNDRGLFPPGTTLNHAYLEARRDTYAAIPVFGIQYYLATYLAGVRVTYDDVDAATAFFADHFGRADAFATDRWRALVDRHGGRLPLLIRAMEEGTKAAPHVPLLTVENTDPEAFWLPSFAETLLAKLWYPMTVAARSYYIRGIIERYLRLSGTPESVAFRLHDFGYRGVSSEETAAIGGAAHLTVFQGTDNVAGLRLLAEGYGAKMAGSSVPASEHSTITMWGRAREADAYRNLLEQYPGGLVSSVSDSYDLWTAVETMYGGELRDTILARDGVLVVRPDSGPPVQTVLRLCHLLERVFGTTTNAKGYRVFPDTVRVIQGDGITDEMVGQILGALVTDGFSADNLTFGSGGGLLQKMDRDTCGFAYKTSYAETDEGPVDVYKDPVTDAGKRSRRGRQYVYRAPDGGFDVQSAPDAAREDLLTPVFRDGEILRTPTLDSIRTRLGTA